MLVAIVESEMEEGMDDVAVHSEHSLVDECGLGSIVGCYYKMSYCCIWYSCHYSTVMNEGGGGGTQISGQLRVYHFT